MAQTDAKVDTTRKEEETTTEKQMDERNSRWNGRDMNGRRTTGEQRRITGTKSRNKNKITEK
jgi:hypothetical protein